MTSFSPVVHRTDHDEAVLTGASSSRRRNSGVRRCLPAPAATRETADPGPARRADPPVRA
ncbi:MAG: hypothetical protein LBU50_00260 [Cellulomonas sp.]|jgi:hypothetical protein|nr:hypothetical protein [Cellulomonas sp.]